jgi:hypothetical protein
MFGGRNGALAREMPGWRRKQQSFQDSGLAGFELECRISVSPGMPPGDFWNTYGEEYWMNAISGIVLKGGLAVLVAGSALALSTNADAATQRATYVTATAACSGPIPSSDGALRRSPIGIRNTGTSNVFISCSVPADFVGDLATGIVEVHFENFGSVEATVNCTLTAGNRFGGFGSVAGSTVMAGGADSYVGWSNVDKHHAWGSYNFSCILPPDVEINTIIDVNQDAGDGL